MTQTFFNLSVTFVLSAVLMAGCGDYPGEAKTYHATCWSGGEPVYSELVTDLFATMSGSITVQEVASNRRVRLPPLCIFIEVPDKIKR